MAHARSRSSSLQEVDESRWNAAVSRFAVVSELAALRQVRRVVAAQRAEELGLSVSYLYKLITDFRRGPQTVTSLIPEPPNGGGGRSRLTPAVDAVIKEVLNAKYLNRQRLPAATIHRMVAAECVRLRLPVPADSTVRRRIEALSPRLVARRRQGADAERKMQPAGRSQPGSGRALERVEIDHTVVDVIVVDRVDREEIGRPYLSVVIDKSTRCMVGMVLTLEAPSRLSVALCLASAASDKTQYARSLGLDVEWPMSGKPSEIFVDNAAEFHSADLRRGCQQHGIRLGFRRPWSPGDGGTVERAIGTYMRKVHELPGTTFSNTAERKGYPSQQLAVMTLPELEKWLILAIAEYHGSKHRSLGYPPAFAWKKAVDRHGPPAAVIDQENYMLDFLPSTYRSIGREGFVWDRIHYLSPALSPWIERRGELGKFRLVRDPRDVSRVWVELPNGGSYLLVPSNSLLEPVSIWEVRALVARQAAEGRSAESAEALLRMRQERSRIVTDAERSTRRTRRNSDRSRGAHPARSQRPQARQLEPPSQIGDEEPAVAFDEMEDW